MLHEIPDYNVEEVTKVENYTRTGKMKYDMTELAKDNETIGDLLYKSFKDVWHKTTKELNTVIDENTLALTDINSRIDTAMQEADPEVFKNNFVLFMTRSTMPPVPSMQDGGVRVTDVQLSGICTYQQYNDYFSARRLGINSGRIFTGVLLR